MNSQNALKISYAIEEYVESAIALELAKEKNSTAIKQRIDDKVYFLQKLQKTLIEIFD